MFEWLFDTYVRLMINFKILSGEVGIRCHALDNLRVFAFTLGVVFFIRLVMSSIVFYGLKKKFVTYSEDTLPRLIALYQSVAQRVGIKNLPPLFQFLDKNPAVFTIGNLKPSIFLAPALVQSLKDEELEAVLAHELTHVKRRDNLIIWILEILFVSLPILTIQLFAIDFVFNGANSSLAIWGTLLATACFKLFLWKRILFYRELSCDDLSVDVVKDPLVLASSLVNVQRLTFNLPSYRWNAGLVFAQTFLTPVSLEARIKRLIDYRRPRFKFLFGNALKLVTVTLILAAGIFWWRFSTIYGNFQVHLSSDAKVVICDGSCVK